jgi:hypothetical protein
MARNSDETHACAGHDLHGAVIDEEPAGDPERKISD